MVRDRRLALASLIALVTGLMATALTAKADVAPDASGPGPLATTSAEYKFAAAIDPDVMTTMPTELWARVYRPAALTAPPYPVVIFLHGNHGTCGHGVNPRIDSSVQYTFTGTCPSGFVVTPNHAGYGYLADRLASWGYIVVSINANRGITGRNGTAAEADDRGLNLARGRLVLKHLQRLAEWDSGISPTPGSLGVDLTGKLDLGNLGLMGHSRGGEGVRAAYNLYRDPGSPWPVRIPEPLSFTAVFEIGPVDGQTSRVLNVDGLTWNVLLPMCDGDVSNLQGVKPFDRALTLRTESPPTQKSTFTVWGANHNFYNTEWQVSDSSGCSGAGNTPLWTAGATGSAKQRLTGLASVLALFRGNTGPAADDTFNQNFDPQYDLPASVAATTRVDQGFTESPNIAVSATFEDFDRATGISSYGFPNDASGISISHGTLPDHGSVDAYGRAGSQRAGAIGWSSSGPATYFQTNWSAPGSGRSIDAFDTLDLRVSRQISGNPFPSTSFSIRLVSPTGALSDPVALADYANLAGPVGGLRGAVANPHPILQTVRIDLADFGIFDLTKVRGIRFTFDDTASGGIYLANVRLANPGAAAAHRAGHPTRRSPASVGGADIVNHVPGALGDNQTVTTGQIKSIRTVASATAAGEPLSLVEIEVSSSLPFEPRDELLTLRVGDRNFTASRYPTGGETQTVIFQLTAEEFDTLHDGELVTIQYGVGAAAQWSLGSLDKSQLNR